MSIKSTLIDLAIVGVLVGAAFSVGYVKGTASGVASESQKVLDARHDTQTAKDNADKANQALDAIRAQLASQRQRLLDAQQVAAAALDQRDQARANFAKANAARKAAERKLANATPDCSDLQHLPICPELARRLFEQPAQAAPGRSAGADNGH